MHQIKNLTRAALLLAPLATGRADDATRAAEQAPQAVALKNPRRLRGAFVDFFEGDGQQLSASRLPGKVTVSVSGDGQTYKPVAILNGAASAARWRARFASVAASHVRFNFGRNTSGHGLRLVEIGVIGD